MANISGTNLAAPIVPFTTDDFFPTHLAQYGKGGWRSVNTLADRDAITDARLELGMSVYVVSEQTLYVLTSLDTTTTPYTKTWSEFKAGSTDSVRKTSSFDNFIPLYDGEIVEYIGEDSSSEESGSGENYVNGYFYQCNYYHTYIDASRVIRSASGDLRVHVELEGEDGFLQSGLQTNTDYTFVRNRGFWECTDPEGITILGNRAGLRIDSSIVNNNDNVILRVEELSGYTFDQKNVQPRTSVIDSLDSTSTTDALSANQGHELNQRINALEGRGRFLSGWNCVTGLAETDPDINPYPYKAGDYYVVTESVKASPEICEAHSDTLTIGFNPFMYKEKVSAVDDRTDVFTYINVTNTPSASNRGTEQVSIVNATKFRETYDHLYDLAVELGETGDRHIVSANAFKIRWFEFMNILYITPYIVCTKTNPLEPEQAEFDEDVALPNGNMSATGMSLEQKQDAIRSFYLENHGLLITGNIYIGDAPWYEEIHLSLDDEPGVSMWKHNGIPLEEGETLSEYGLSINGEPVDGDSIIIEFISEKKNFRPDGTQYVIGVASTTLETEDVFKNDTYMYDGTTWLLMGGQPAPEVETITNAEIDEMWE